MKHNLRIGAVVARKGIKVGQTAIQLRAPPDGSLQTRSGFFSVASIGNMPATAAGGSYILEASAALSDGRVLKLNAAVLCKSAGP